MLRAFRPACRLCLMQPGRALSSNPPKSREQIMQEKTPRGKLDDDARNHNKKVKEVTPYVDPHLPRHPNGINPTTGEVGGPAGVEPTRFGDWERKGRVSDF